MDVSRLTKSERNCRHESYIQKKIKSFKGGALIGVEYALEIYERLGGVCTYRCILCDLLTRNILSHFTSYDHRVRYLQKHYPTVVRTYRLFQKDSNRHKESRIIVQIMAEAIENCYGWLPVKSISEEEFYCDPNHNSEDVLNSFHYDETMGPDFIDVVAERFPKKCEMRYNAETNAKFRLNHKFVVKNTDSVCISSRHKWDKYHTLLQERIMIIEALQAEYDKSPESHPSYSDEWDMFWVRRYKQLKSENKTDPKTYDYKPEWVIYWSQRMKELYNDEIKQAKYDIKLSLGLPEDAEDSDNDYHTIPEKRDSQNVQELGCTSPMHRTRSPSPHEWNLQKHKYPRSRSRSPLQFSNFQNREEFQSHSHVDPHSDYNCLDKSGEVCRIFQKEDEEAMNVTQRDKRNLVIKHYVNGSNKKHVMREFIDTYQKTEFSLSGRIPHIIDEKSAVIFNNCRQIRTLAVIDRSVNDCGITHMNWKKMEKPLTDALVEVLKRNHGPVAQFRDAGWYQGRIKLIEFKENRSPSLYRQALKSLGQIWPSARLDLTELSEIPNRPRAYTKVPAKPSRPCEILEIIQQSNAEMPTYNWKIQKVSFNKGGFRQVNLTINGKSIEQLQQMEGVIRYGSETIKLRIFKEDI